MKTDEKTHVEIGRYLVVDPEICHGKLTFKGTRIPVATVLTYLAMGDSMSDVLRNWPRLQKPAVEEAIRFAARLVQKSYPTRKKAA
ncbi:DUF433 domain-containing protein [candidate division KSB1 bacterium]|nr:DUF433 domain-containing protein [candidate division KSB1 bacterium]